jgi:hypothetical protein
VWCVVSFVALYLRASGCCGVCLKLVTWACAPSLYEFGDHPQGSLSGSRILLLWERIENNTVALVAYWSVLFLHTAPTESSIRKGVNFGIHRCLLVYRLLLNPSSFTYAFYIVIAFALDVLSPCYLSCLA